MKNKTQDVQQKFKWTDQTHFDNIYSQIAVNHIGKQPNSIPDWNPTICAEDYSITFKTLNSIEDITMSVWLSRAIYEDKFKFKDF